MATIFFSHANSFGLYTYKRIVRSLEAAGYSVRGVEQFGHDPRYPVSNNWPHFVEQLRDLIECTLMEQQAACSASDPVVNPAAEKNAGVVAPPEIYLVGHSLGGYVSALCASCYPVIAGVKIKGVILLDAPLLGGWRARLVASSKHTGMIGRISPAKISQHRRKHWGSVEDARKHFLSKPLFQRWHPEVLNDYMEHGLAPVPKNIQDSIYASTERDSQERELRFTREVESRIYNTLVHNFDKQLRAHPIECPVAFVEGSLSNEVRQVGLGLTHKVVAKHPQGRLYRIEGSHLFPMESPDQTAETILDCLAYWRAAA